MDDDNRTIRLFGYEWDNGRGSILWENPIYFRQPGGQSGKMLDEAFENWQKQKRAFTRDEILQGSWVKVGDHGHHFIVRFHANGDLTETGLFNTSTSWQGAWQLIGSVLRMRVNKYELDIFANRDSVIHSGIEIDTTSHAPNAYFKVIHVP